MSQQQLAQTTRHNAPQLSAVNGPWLQRKCACGSYGVGSCDKCGTQDSLFNRGPARQPITLQRQAAAGAGAATSQPTTTPTSQPAPPAAAATATAANLRGPGGFGNYDAEFDRNAAINPQRSANNEPCRLALTIRVKFNFTDSETPSRWTPAEQSRWTNDYVRAVSNRWSFRFLLQPKAACATEPCQLATAILRVEPVSSNPHHTINVLWEKPGGRGSMTELYHSSVERDGRDLRTNQILATHEAGHLLGLDHVHCNTNDDQCYGTNREESADVMGRGEIVTERDYQSFVMAADQLTGCNWQVRDGARGPLFGKNALALGLTLGAMGAAVGAIGGAALGLGGAIGFGVLGGLAGGLIGAGIGSALD